MDLDRIRRLADAFDASDWDEVDIVVDGVRVRFSAGSVPGDGHHRSTEPPEGAPDRPAGGDPDSSDGHHRPGEPSGGAPRQDPEADHDGEPADVPAEVPPEATGDPVGAPSPGIFWRAPSPGEAPFVTVGDHVDADSVVGIVELMKLMNRVAAGVAGTVTAVLVDNGQSVAKAESLVLVEPDP